MGFTTALTKRTVRTALGNKVAGDNLLDGIDFGYAPGKIWFVDSATGSDAAGAGTDQDSPFASIGYAFSSDNVQANKGDVVFVLPGHSETVSSATGCVMDIAGVTVIGLGRGSLQPTITLDTAAGSTVSITAANMHLRNLRIVSDFTNGVTAGITLGASADGCVLEGITMNETSATKEYLIGISIAAACNDVEIYGLRYHGTAGGTTSSAITLAGACNNFVLKDSYINVDASGAIVDGSTAASTNVEISYNRLINIDTAAGLGVAFHNSSTGMVTDNRITNLKNAVLGLSGTGLSYHENYGSNAAGAQGTVALALAVDT